MKKNILAIAIASAVATPVAFANAPTVYGQFNMALEDITHQGNNVVHRNSRVGIKGSEDLGNGLKAVYQAEGTLANSNRRGAFGASNGINGATNFSFDRNTFVGLAGGFGTVVMGRHDTPLRMIQPSDGFVDAILAGNNRGAFTGLTLSALGNQTLMTSGGVNATADGSASGEDRLDNVLAYISPSFNGVQFAVAASSAAIGTDGSANNAAGAVVTNSENGIVTTRSSRESSIANIYSGSLSYGSKSEGIYAAVAMTHVGETVRGLKNERNNTRATVQWNKNGLLLNAMYNNLDVGSGTNIQRVVNGAAVAGSSYDRNFNKGQALTLGAAYKMGAFTPRAKIAIIEYKDKFSAAATGTDWNKNSTSMALGLDYSLGKNTNVYAEYAMLDKNNRAFSTREQTTTAGNTKRVDTSSFAVGMLHKF